jgi:hypothetical protein
LRILTLLWSLKEYIHRTNCLHKVHGTEIWQEYMGMYITSASCVVATLTDASILDLHDQGILRGISQECIDQTELDSVDRVGRGLQHVAIKTITVIKTCLKSLA